MYLCMCMWTCRSARHDEPMSLSTPTTHQPAAGAGDCHRQTLIHLNMMRQTQLCFAGSKHMVRSTPPRVPIAAASPKHISAAG